ncbi:uncharacterized protein HD556DRAFT_839180 [Suillus plorans]|uniref:Secreted protein n=1 Tax=Suillus plorans TaxID=116603 RepID=A0A9P7DE69_9AGAM|nr:uncharacterized protein HD556DRAFT_839180 [Suillus plorans]KAG1788888.1 hypothetical protein HD556DRAFT_839180 [Suillus plorans]
MSAARLNLVGVELCLRFSLACCTFPMFLPPLLPSVFVADSVEANISYHKVCGIKCVGRRGRQKTLGAGWAGGGGRKTPTELS